VDFGAARLCSPSAATTPDRGSGPLAPISPVRSGSHGLASISGPTLLQFDCARDRRDMADHAPATTFIFPPTDNSSRARSTSNSVVRYSPSGMSRISPRRPYAPRARRGYFSASRRPFRSAARQRVYLIFPPNQWRRNTRTLSAARMSPSRPCCRGTHALPEHSIRTKRGRLGGRNMHADLLRPTGA
jgi:hypothetical protein